MIKKWFKLKRNNIILVQLIIEGYEGMASVTTIDPHAAIIQVSIMPDFLQEIINLLESLKNKYCLEEIECYDYNSHSSGTFVRVVVGSSEYEKSTPVSPPPSRHGVILNAKWNKANEG
jgi:hypothetical protein